MITIDSYTKGMPQGTRKAVCGTAAPTHPLFGGVSGHHVGQVLLLQLRLLLAHRLLVLGLHGRRVQVELLRVQGHLHPLHRAPLLRALLPWLHLQPWSQITDTARRPRAPTLMQQLVRLLVQDSNSLLAAQGHPRTITPSSFHHKLMDSAKLFSYANLFSSQIYKITPFTNRKQNMHTQNILKNIKNKTKQN